MRVKVERCERGRGSQLSAFSYPSAAAWEALPFFLRSMAPSSRETPWAKPVRAASEEERGLWERGRERGRKFFS